MSETQQVCPSPADLDLLELMRSGAYRPTAGQARLVVPATGTAPSAVELVDPEGVPLTELPVEEINGRLQADLAGVTNWTGRLSSRPFESLYQQPAQVRAVTADGAQVFVVNRPVDGSDLADVPDESQVVLLVLAGPSTAPSASTLSLLRSICGLAASRPGTHAVAVPLAADAATTHPDMYAAVLNTYAPHGRVLLEAEAALPPPTGVVLFFTGLSGSGKSTVARSVRNTILERYVQPVTLLDGDVVRRALSAGLSFSPEDRETNIRRIGWVAAQIAHHGGIAICSPIAPYESTREWVRALVTENGGRFILIHVSTPLEICEERDRKGLYAKARAGLIPDFTGISAPYEEPTEADLVLDTATMTIDQARDRVQHLLTTSGIL